MIHGHDGIGGKIVWTTDVLGTTGNTTQTILSNVSGASINLIIKNAVTNSINFNSYDITSANGAFQLSSTTGPSTTNDLEIEITNNGDFEIRRINGTATYEIIAEIIWL